MDLSSLWAAIRETWDTLWEASTAFINPGLFFTSLVVFLVFNWLFPGRNTALKVIFLAFIGAAAYGLVLSLNFIREWSGGGSVAMIVAIVVMLSKVGSIWEGSMGWPGKVTTVFLAVMLILAAFSIVGNFTDVSVGSQLNAALSRTGDFLNRLFGNVERGARQVQ